MKIVELHLSTPMVFPGGARPDITALWSAERHKLTMKLKAGVVEVQRVLNGEPVGNMYAVPLSNVLQIVSAEETADEPNGQSESQASTGRGRKTS